MNVPGWVPRPRVLFTILVLVAGLAGYLTMSR